MSEMDIEGAKALKIAIYTQVLDLTEEEAQKFWPIFNEFEKKQTEIREEMNSIRKEVELKFKELSDKELEEKIDQMLALRKKEVELTEVYYAKYKTVLPIRKVALIHKAEMMYKRALLRKVREKHQGDR